MKNLFSVILSLIWYSSYSQTISSNVIASDGGYYSAGGSSLSWTLGETFNNTFLTSNYMLTQGFQQPEIKITLLNVTAFLEGFYRGSGTQTSTLYELGYTMDATATDTVQVNLWNVAHLTNPLPDYSQKVILHSNGSVVASFRGVNSASYYIALKHRNSIETWNAVPVAINNTNISYDFAASQSSAFGNNLQNMLDGRFALFSGDSNQDGVIESQDYSDMENDVSAILTGYVPTDITGDAVVESSDYSITENNVSVIISIQRP